MSSITTTPITVTGKDETVPVGELSADKGETKPARAKRGRPPMAVSGSANHATEQEIAAVDAGKETDFRSITSKATKTAIVLKKLRSARGQTIAQLGEATGWQAHSVRGFLSGTVRKKLGLSLSSEVGKDGLRRYRIANDAGSSK